MCDVQDMLRQEGTKTGSSNNNGIETKGMGSKKRTEFVLDESELSNSADVKMIVRSINHQ